MVRAELNAHGFYEAVKKKKKNSRIFTNCDGERDLVVNCVVITLAQINYIKSARLNGIQSRMDLGCHDNLWK